MPKKTQADRDAEQTHQPALRATGIPKTYKNHWFEQKLRRCLGCMYRGDMRVAGNLMTITVIPYTKFGVAADRNLVECIVGIVALRIQKRCITNKLETPETTEPFECFLGSLVQEIASAAYRNGDATRTREIRAALGL